MEKAKSELELPVKAVDAIEEVAGTFPGYRRAHAKGQYYRAVFTPNGKASALTKAPHLLDKPVPAIVRFSNSSPNPTHADALTPPKGMAVQFQLPDGSITNLVGVTLPIFFAKTPEAFVEIMKFFKSAEDGVPNLKELMKIAVKYPESKVSLNMIKEMCSPFSFAMARYFSIHVFNFINKEGRKQPIKYQWEPDAGLGMFGKLEAANCSADYLNEELTERVQKGSVGFTLTIQLGEENDPTNDPTVAWPAERQTIEIGHLTISKKMIDTPDHVLFDPTIVPEGIECSDDPILHFRHDAYAVSYNRRIDHK